MTDNSENGDFYTNKTGFDPSVFKSSDSKYPCKKIVLDEVDLTYMISTIQNFSRTIEKLNVGKPDTDLKLAITNLDKAALYLDSYKAAHPCKINRSSSLEDIDPELEYPCPLCGKLVNFTGYEFMCSNEDCKSRDSAVIK